MRRFRVLKSQPPDTLGTQEVDPPQGDTFAGIIGLCEVICLNMGKRLQAYLSKEGCEVLNYTRALLLYRIEQVMRVQNKSVIAFGDIIRFGAYHRANVSYNVRKLTECGFLSCEKSEHDRRGVDVQITEKGRNICALIARFNAEQEANIIKTVDNAQTIQYLAEIMQLFL